MVALRCAGQLRSVQKSVWEASGGHVALVELEIASLQIAVAFVVQHLWWM